MVGDRAHKPPLSPPRPGSGQQPAQRTHQFAPNQLIGGKYAIERVLGEGAVGIVLAVRNTAIDELVALKVLRAEHLGIPMVVERFTREAIVASSIRSPHVAQIYDVGSLDDGTPFLVMEHLQGETLNFRLGRGALPFREAATYIIQACEGLAEAHGRGIIHRDIKPENLFISQQPSGNSIKLLDFGLAKATTKGAGLLEPFPAQVGAYLVLGTPAYISPEQLASPSTVDERTDIWSLGVTLFEMLTNALPFEAQTVPEVCDRVASGSTPSLRVILANAPQALDDIVSRCLMQDPERRFANVAELAAALVPFAGTDGKIAARRTERLLVAAGKVEQPTLNSTMPPLPDAVDVSVPEHVTNLCATLIERGALSVVIVDMSSNRVLATHGSTETFAREAPRYLGLMHFQSRTAAMLGLGDVTDFVVELQGKQCLLRPLVSSVNKCICVLVERQGMMLKTIREALAAGDTAQ